MGRARIWLGFSEMKAGKSRMSGFFRLSGFPALKAGKPDKKISRNQSRKKPDYNYIIENSSHFYENKAGKSRIKIDKKVSSE